MRIHQWVYTLHGQKPTKNIPVMFSQDEEAGREDVAAMTMIIVLQKTNRSANYLHMNLIKGRYLIMKKGETLLIPSWENSASRQR